MPRPRTDRFNEISHTNKQAIQDFIAHIKTRFHKETTQNNYFNCIISFIRRVNKDFRDITNKDIDRFLSNLNPRTAETMKPTIKKFFIYHNMEEIAKGIPSNSKILLAPTNKTITATTNPFLILLFRIFFLPRKTSGVVVIS